MDLGSIWVDLLDDGKRFLSDGRCMGDPEDYSIAREGVWGREGLAAAAEPEAGG